MKIMVKYRNFYDNPTTHQILPLEHRIISVETSQFSPGRTYPIY